MRILKLAFAMLALPTALAAVLVYYWFMRAAPVTSHSEAPIGVSCDNGFARWSTNTSSFSKSEPVVIDGKSVNCGLFFKVGSQFMTPDELNLAILQK
ncbi:hypothetical protein ACYHMX_30640 (plasmid) [Pseudomonas amygdali pv. morsprunorum]